MSRITNIDVQDCDNEIMIVASQNAGSSVLCHLKSGKQAPVSYDVNPANILAAGSYSLTIVGINWGGDGKFRVSISGDNPIILEGGGPETGVVFTKTIPMTI